MSDESKPNGHGFNGDDQTPRPEYIILDGETSDEQSQQQHRSDRFEDISSVVTVKVPWILRIFFLLLAMLCAVWFCAALVGWVIASVGYNATLQRSAPLRAWMSLLWLNVMRAAVICIGFLISLVSPPLGMGFIMLYCMLHEDQEAMLAKMVRSNFSKYTR